MPTLPEANSPSAPPPTWRINLDLLDANPWQPRREMDEGPLQELMGSLENHGLLQPITVRRVAGGRYQVIAGHRRLEAFRRLLELLTQRGDAAAERFRTIPAHEKFDVTDEEMALFALIENLQRDDLSPLDAALGLARFQETHQLSTEALSKRTGVELDRAKRLLRLSRAPAVIQDACHKGVLVEQQAEGGAVKRLPSGNPKHERLRLDLMAALEFSRLHANTAKTAPKKADERTARAIERALSERWSYRRIQAYCRAAVAGEDAPTGGGPMKATTEPKTAETALPLFTDGPELRIQRSRIPGAAPEQRQALMAVVKALWAELTATASRATLPRVSKGVSDAPSGPV